MSLAKKILQHNLKNTKVDEKVKSQFFDDMSAVASNIEKVKVQDNNAKALVTVLIQMVLELSEVNEEGALAQIKALTSVIKKAKIEEGKLEEGSERKKLFQVLDGVSDLFKNMKLADLDDWDEQDAVGASNNLKDAADEIDKLGAKL